MVYKRLLFTGLHPGKYLFSSQVYFYFKVRIFSGRKRDQYRDTYPITVQVDVHLRCKFFRSKIKLGAQKVCTPSMSFRQDVFDSYPIKVKNNVSRF